MANTKATLRRAAQNVVAAKGPAYSLKTAVATVTAPDTASVGSTLEFFNLPSNARIHGSSTIYWEDMSTATTTLDLGVGAVDSNLTNADDPNGLSDAHDVTSASNQPAVDGITNYGKPLWDFVASETSDPGGELKVYATIVDGVAATTGTSATLEMNYYVD